MIDWSIGIMVRGRAWAYRVAGVWFILWSSVTMLYSLVLLVLGFLAPPSQRVGDIVEAAAFLVLSFLVLWLGMRFVSITAKDLEEFPSRVAALRDRFERWVNRESKGA